MRTASLFRLILMLLSYHFGQSCGSLLYKYNEIMFNRNATGVYFNPEEFVDGNRLPGNLDTTGVQALVNKIHTRFDKILLSFPLTNSRYGENSSNALFPEVVAKKNVALNESVSQPMEVIVLFHVTTWENKTLLKTRLKQARAQLDKANSIYPGTVSVILLDMTRGTEISLPTYLNFRYHFRKTDGLQGYKVGVQVDISHCTDYSTNLNLRPSYSKWMHGVGLGFVDMIYFSHHGMPSNSNEVSEADLTIHLAQFSRCRQLVQLEGSGTEVGFTTTWPDTDLNAQLKYSNLVSFWREMNSWAANTSTSIILLQAFDTPFAKDPIMKTNGWWRLLPNSSYEHPSQYQFEEKGNLVNESKLANVSWMRPEMEFSRSCVGVSFAPVILMKDLGKSQSDREAILSSQIQMVTTRFSTILIPMVPNVQELEFSNSTILIPGIAAKFLNNSKPDYIKNDSPNVEIIIMFDDTTAAKASKSSREANTISSGTVKRLVYDPTDLDNPRVSKNYLNLIRTLNGLEEYELGIRIPIERCIDSADFFNDMKLVYGLPITTIYFSGIVSVELSKLGVERVLPLSIAMFENCQKQIDKYYSRLNESIQITFITGWPQAGEESLEGNVAFVRFWEQLDDWANKTNSKIILTSALDPPHRGALAGGGSSKVMHGWWRLLENETLAGSGDEYIFVDKKGAALRYAARRSANELSTIFFDTPMILLSLFIVIVFLLCLLAVPYQVRKRNPTKLTKQDIAEYLHGGLLLADEKGARAIPHKELPKSSFTIDEESPLGSGAFGKVCRGMVAREGGKLEQVAVKMTKVPCSRTALRGFWYEIKVLSFLGKHPHIVELVGAYTAELKRSRVFLFLELCSLGSLESYLRKLKSVSKGNCPESEDDVESISIGENSYDCQQKGNELEDELTCDMARWSREIATGMEFIASKHVVHLDIATRNVLLTSQKQAKITDFGLSRRLFHSQIYTKKTQEPLPWRWMSPEALRKSEFTEKSDVWAFGVTLWEIYSLGEEPYPGLCFDVNFPTQLERGLRLGMPEHDQGSMHSLMLRCWTVNPEERPTFSELVRCLTHGSTEASQIEMDTSGKVSQPAAAITWKANDWHLKKPMAQAVARLWWLSLVILTLLVIGIACLALHNMGNQQDPIHPSTDKQADSIVFIPSNKTFPDQPQPPPDVVDDTGSQANSEEEARWDAETTTTTETIYWNDSDIINILNRPELSMGGPGKSKFNLAAERGDLRRVKEFVQAGEDVNARSRYASDTPLHAASRFVRLDVVMYLLENGADVYAVDVQNRTFLHCLLLHGTTLTPKQFHQMCSYLIARNYSQLFNTFGGIRPPGTPLQWALRNVKVQEDTLSLLYKNSVNFNLVNDHGISSLVYAIVGGADTKLLSQLILFGADPQQLDLNQMGILHRAAVDGDLEVLEFVINLGLDINGRVETTGSTPLHYTLEKNPENPLQSAMILVENGADVNSQDLRLGTPLHHIITNPGINNSVRISIIKYLIEQGADPTAKDDDGDIFLHRFMRLEMSPEELHLLSQVLVEAKLSKLFDNPDSIYGETSLHLAVHSVEVSIETLTLLHNNSVHFNALSVQGNSPLAYAINGGRSVQLMTHLLQFGADFRSLNNGNQSMLHLAVHVGHLETLSFLLKLDLDVNGADWNGATPLHNAVQFGKDNVLEMAELLIGQGAEVRSRNKQEQTPLHGAARNKLITDIEQILELVHFLIKNGADVMAVDDQEATFLSWILDRISKPSEFHTVLENVIDSNYSQLFDTRLNSGLPPLHVVFYRMELGAATLELLTKHGFNFLALDGDGNSMLVYAILGGRSSKFLARLLHHGMDWRGLNKKNRSLLHFAASGADIEVLKFVLSLGLDVNGGDVLGLTPLHVAVAKWREDNILEAVTLLIENGADVTAKAKNGMSPFIVSLTRSKMAGWMEVAGLLTRARGGDGDSSGQSHIHVERVNVPSHIAAIG